MTFIFETNTNGVILKHFLALQIFIMAVNRGQDFEAQNGAHGGFQYKPRGDWFFVCCKKKKKNLGSHEASILSPEHMLRLHYTLLKTLFF